MAEPDMCARLRVTHGRRLPGDVVPTGRCPPGGRVLLAAGHSGSNGHSETPDMLIAVVGPCASGKTSLVRELRTRKYNAHEVAQEHSLVPDMWRRITRPHLMVYLDVSPGVACLRRRMDAPPPWWTKAAGRLEAARREADFYILTDALTPQEVLERTLMFLEEGPTAQVGSVS